MANPFDGDRLSVLDDSGPQLSLQPAARLAIDLGLRRRYQDVVDSQKQTFCDAGGVNWTWPPQCFLPRT